MVTRLSSRNVSRHPFFSHSIWCYLRFPFWSGRNHHWQYRLDQSAENQKEHNIRHYRHPFQYIWVHWSYLVFCHMSTLPVTAPNKASSETVLSRAPPDPIFGLVNLCRFSLNVRLTAKKIVKNHASGAPDTGDSAAFSNIF